jgi:hypothetical protein
MALQSERFGLRRRPLKTMTGYTGRSGQRAGLRSDKERRNYFYGSRIGGIRVFTSAATRQSVKEAII